MSDSSALIGTAVFILFFLVTGILGILDNPVTKLVLFGGFLILLGYIVFVKTKNPKS